jgi:PAS domain S-box-containing protein
MPVTTGFPGDNTARPGGTIAIWLPLGLSVVAAAVYALAVYMPEARKDAVAEARARLTARADDRAAAIEVWLGGLRQAVRTLAAYPAIRRATTGGSAEAQVHVAEILDVLASAHEGYSVYVFDDTQRLVAQDASASRRRDWLAQLAALRGGQVAVMQHASGQSVVAVAALIRCPGESSEPSVAGKVVLVDIAEDEFTTMLLRESVPTETAEVLMGERHGDALVFFTPLRHRRGRDVLQVSLTEASSGALSAVLHNGRGFGSYIDYRGVPVFAAATMVPDTSWGLVAKIDQAEVLLPYQRHVRETGIVAIGLVTAFAISWLAVLKSRRARFELMLLRARARIDLLRNFAHDPILVTDDTGRIIDANGRFEIVYGMDRARLEHLTVRDLRAPDESALHRMDGGGAVFEEVHQSTDGRTFPVEISRERAELDDQHVQVWIVRDISERRAALARIQHLNRLLRTQSEINQLVFRERNGNRLLQAATQTLVEVAGLGAATVYLTDQEQGTLVPVARAGSGGEPLSDAEAVARDAASPLWRVLFDGQVLVVTGPVAGIETAPDGTRYETTAIVPLKRESRVLGLLQVHCQDAALPDDESVALLEELTSDLAFALAAIESAEEQARSERERQRSEARYRTLADNFPNGSVMLFDQELRFTLAAGESLPLVGLSRSWLEGRTLTESLPDPAARVLKPLFRAALAGHKTVRQVSFHNRRFNLIILPVFDHAGQVQAGMVVAQDHTETLQAQDELQRLKRFYESVLEAVTEGIWVTDREGIITYVNDGMAKIAGAPRETLVGTPIELKLAGSSSIDLTRLYVEARTSLSPRRYDAVTQVTAAGRTTVQSGWFIPIVRNGVFEGMIGTTEDISERQLLHQQLLHAQRLDAVGRLAGGIAHDFNNLLSAILGYSELVAADLAEGDPRREDMKEVIRAAERATGLTRQLLAFSRKQVLQPRTIDVNEAVQELERMLHRIIGEDVELEIACGAGDPWVHVDPSQLEQVLVNLAVNSRDAMPSGGRLKIETANAVRAGVDDVGISPAHPGPYVVLRVSDTGCGMDAAVLSRIFEPFFTTKEPGKGTGLGLSTVYGIIQQSGGDIAVRSAPDQGATFVIYLPVSNLREAPRPVERPQRRARGTETILVVEDSVPLRILMRNVLVDEGYRVLDASNGEEALRVVDGHGGRIDLVLTDVVMPRLNGIDLVRRLRQDAPDLQVVFASGYSPETVLPDDVPGATFVAKPFRPSVLLGRVRSVLDGVATG